jgi:hypothetical protein
MEIEVAQEVPVEDAAVMPVGEPRNRRRDRWNLAAERRQRKQQERTRRSKWVPKGFGRSPQWDDPPCSDGTAQEKFLWTPQTIGRRPQKGDRQCSSSMAQGKIHQERSDKDSERGTP